MNEVEVENSLGEDGEDSKVAILLNDLAVNPSRENSDDELIAKREPLDLNHRTESVSPMSSISSKNWTSNQTGQKSSIHADGRITYSSHNRVNPEPHQNGASSRTRSQTRDSRERRKLEQLYSTVQTNVLPPISDGVVYLCKISCRPAAMPGQEKRMLIKEFLQYLNITPCLGRVVFLNGHTFLTKDLHPKLAHGLFLGSFWHRRSKFDEKSKLISNDSEMQPSVWSNLYGRLTQRSQAVSRSAVKHVYDNLEILEASASCTVEKFDFSDLCSPRKHQGTTRDLKKYISDFNNLYSPGLPSTALDAPEQEQIVVHGNKTFDFRRAGYSLGFGLEVRNGALLVVRATEKGLVRVVTPCQKVFFAPMKASSFMTAHWPNCALDPIKASADFNSVFRGLRVLVRQANGVERRATVSEVSFTCPSDTVFDVFEGGVQSRTTVEEYFSRRTCSDTSRDLCLTNGPTRTRDISNRFDFTVPQCRF